MLVAFRPSKLVDTKYFEKAATAQTTMTAEKTVIATKPRRLDCEHLVHVVDIDEEYPLWQTEQSAQSAHKKIHRDDS